MSKATRLLLVWLLGPGLALAVLVLFHQGQPPTVQAAAPPLGARLRPLANPLNEAPAAGTVKVLYDGSLGGTPGTQGFTYIPIGAANETAAGGATTLNTLASSNIQAGYFSNEPLNLDRNSGYTVRFFLQVISETHTGSDRNGDGLDDRAGFSIIVISSQAEYAIELGFWTDRIWAQEDGPLVPPGGDLFTQAEGVPFNTTIGLIPYELTILGQEYSLVANNTEILTGTLRDYTPFMGFPDVYENPNFIFIGDNTQSARASFKLAYVSAITNRTLPDRTVATDTPLLIDRLGVLDIDAAGQDIVATLTVQHGILNVNNGLNGQVSGHGTKTLVFTGTVAEINHNLGLTLTYRSQPGFAGEDIATFSLNDLGHTGAGGPLTDTKQFTITVLGPALHLTKTVSTLNPLPGQRVTYTLSVANSSNLTATQALISDTLPAGLTLAEPASLTPAGAGTIGDPPALVSGLTLNPGQQVTATFPVTVSASLSHGTQITNTATITSAEITVSVTSTVVLTVNRSINLRLTKAVTAPSPLRPGDPVTYTLTFSNTGPATAINVVISDPVPAALLTNLSYSASGATLTPTAGLPYQWQVADLATNQGGTITLTGRISAGLSVTTTFTNTATITGSGNETNPTNNLGAVNLTVRPASPPPNKVLYLPSILKQSLN